MNLSSEQIALLLVDAYINGPSAASEVWKVSISQIDKLRTQMVQGELPEAQEAYRRHLEQTVTDWKNEANVAVKEGFAWAQRVFKEADPGDPKAIEACAKLIGSLAEITTAKQLMDERFKKDKPTANPQLKAVR